MCSMPQRGIPLIAKNALLHPPLSSERLAMRVRRHDPGSSVLPTSPKDANQRQKYRALTRKNVQIDLSQTDQERSRTMIRSPEGRDPASAHGGVELPHGVNLLRHRPHPLA